MQNNLTRNLIDLYLLCYRISWLLTFTDLNHCAGLFAAPLFLPGQNRSRKCCVSTFRRSRILFKMQPRNRIFDASMSGPHKDATMITVNARFGSSSSWGPELRTHSPEPKAQGPKLRTIYFASVYLLNQGRGVGSVVEFLVTSISIASGAAAGATGQNLIINSLVATALGTQNMWKG